MASSIFPFDFTIKIMIAMKNLPSSDEKWQGYLHRQKIVWLRISGKCCAPEWRRRWVAGALASSVWRCKHLWDVVTYLMCKTIVRVQEILGDAGKPWSYVIESYQIVYLKIKKPSNLKARLAITTLRHQWCWRDTCIGQGQYLVQQ